MLSRWRTFARDKRGLAAVEFALIAPVLVTLLLGTVEVCDALAVHEKVTMLASTGADLVAQASSVSATDMSNIFAADSAVLFPYDGSIAQIVISSIVSDGKGGGTVAWSQAQNGTPLSVGRTMTIPTGLMDQSRCPANACSVILAQVSYGYKSPVGKFIIGTVAMTDSFYERPRRGATVSYTG
ncbi:MAG: pilus assembly protein [Alphaproteobacteria bacterium]|nr:pilus assembly protein [Alphaproteobacteria bacterium]